MRRARYYEKVTMADLDLTSVLRKTESGVNAIKLRDRALTPKHRMMLIVVDGMKTVGELMKPMSNPEETRQVLGELLSSGFVCEVDLPKPNLPTQAMAAMANSKTSEALLKAAIGRATHKLEELLGPTSEALCLQLEKCASYERFIDKVNDLHGIVTTMHSAKKADEFVAAALRP